SGLSSKVQQEIDERKRADEGAKDGGGDGEKKKPTKPSDVDRHELEAKKGELHADLQPVTPKPQEKQGEIASAAASAKQEAHAPPKPAGPAGGAHQGPPHGGAGGAAVGGDPLASAAQASALAQTAFAQGDAVKLPDPPPPVVPPPPVEAIDAGGKPLP